MQTLIQNIRGDTKGDIRGDIRGDTRVNVRERGLTKTGRLTGGSTWAFTWRLIITRGMEAWQTLLLMLALLLSACGESESNSPEGQVSPPTLHTTGAAALGLVSNADITAYAITPASRNCAYNSLQKIGEGQSDDQGNYNMTIQSASDFVLLRLTDGSYIEEASGVKVHLLQDQALYAIGEIISQDKSMRITLSPLSSIQAGMFCYLIEQTDSSLVAAHLDATNFITSYAGFDPRYVAYKDPTTASNNHASIALDSGLLLGLLNAGISQYSYDLSLRAEGETIAHNYINSVYVAQHFFNDIYQDGELDGQGLTGSLLIGPNNYIEPLSPASYLLDLPKSVLKFYDDNVNNEIIKDRAVIYKMASRMNSVKHPMVFPDADEGLPLDKDSPQVTWLSSKVLSGIENITLQVTDLTSVQAIAVLGREDIFITHVQDNIYSFAMDSTTYNSGEHQLSIIATDTLGNQGTSSFHVAIINDAPIINVTSMSSTKESSFRFTFRVTKAHQQQQVDYSNSVCILSSSQSSQPKEYPIRTENDVSLCEVELYQDINNIQVVLCDTNFLCSTESSHSVKYDITPPNIMSVSLENAYRGNVSFRIDVADALSGIHSLPQYSAVGNGQSLLGEAVHLNNTEYLIYFDASRFGNGNIEIKVTASDQENNQGSSTFSTLVVNQPAMARLTSPTLFGYNHASFTFTISENSYKNIKITCRVPGHTAITSTEYSALDNSATCSIFTPTLPDGKAGVQLSICGDHNLCNSQTFAIFKDSQPPDISFANLESSYTQTGESVTLTITDSNLDEDNLFYKIDDEARQSLIKQGNNWTLTLPPSLVTGRHQLKIMANDVLGNTAEVTEKFILLLDAPAITLTSSAATKDDAYTLTAVINPQTYAGDYSATCTNGRIIIPANVRNNLLTCNLNLASAGDGEITIDISLTADYGTTYNNQLTITKDKTPPTISFIDLKNSYTQTGERITLTIADSNLDEDSLFYKIDDKEKQSLIKQGNNWTLTLPPSLVTGRHQLKIMANDVLGNTAEVTEKFILLLDEPSFTLTSSTATRDDAYTLTATVDPNSYTGSYDTFCILGRTTVPANLARGILTCNINLGDERDGDITINVKLIADYGTEYEFTSNLEKDSTPPVIRFTTIETSYSATGENIVLTIDDSNIDITKLTYRLGAKELPLVKRGNAWIAAIPASLNTGEHTIAISAADTLGNKASVSRSFFLLKDEPAITLTSPTATRDDAYTLTAVINPQTYAGDYSATCTNGRIIVPANVRNNLLTCNLNLASAEDGEITIDISLTADYGESYKRQLTITKDKTPPTISLIDLANSYTQSGESVTLTITDSNLDEDNLFYKIDDEARQSLIKQGDNWILTLPPFLVTGRHQLKIMANDVLGNTAEVTEEFILLLDEPSFTLTSPSKTKDNAYALTATVDPNSYTGSYDTFCILGRTTVPANLARGILTCNINLGDERDGDININIKLIADYGTEYEFISNLEKDSTPPVIRFTTIETSYSATGENIVLTIDDSNIDITKLTYRLGTEELPLVKRGNDWIAAIPASLNTGEHTIAISAADTLGNKASVSRSFFLLKDEPAITLTSPTTTKDDAYTLTATIDPQTYAGDYSATCTNGRIIIPANIRDNLLTCNLNLASTGDGEITIDISLTADYGESYKRQLTIAKDTTPPSIRFLDIANSYTQTGESITLTITDSNLDEDSLFYKLGDEARQSLIKQGSNWILTLPPSLITGRHQLKIIAKDVLGNTAEVTEEFILLLDEPSFTLTSPAVTRDDAYTLTATIDPQTYAGDYSATCTNGRIIVPANVRNNLLTCNLNLASAGDGEIIIDISLIADYGTTYNNQLTIVKDTTPPSIRFLDIANSYTQTGERVTLTITDSNLDEDNLFYKLGDAARQSLIKQGSNWILTLPPFLVTGRHQLKIMANDVLGNTAAVTEEFILLLDEPAITLTSPVATRDDAYTLTATIDPQTYAGDYTVTCGNNRVVVPANIRNNLLTCNLNLASAGDGEITIDISLTADYGESYKRQLTITKDTTPPTISCPFNSGYGGNTAQRNDGNVIIECTIDDIHSAISKVAYRNPTEENNLMPLAKPYHIILQPANYADGSHIIDVSAEDELGNAVQASYSFEIDKAPPTLSVPSRIHTKKDNIDISGTYQESNLASITCLGMKNGISQELDIPAQLPTNNTFLCADYLVTNANLEDAIEIKACDIYDNCASYSTRVLYDSHPPKGDIYSAHPQYSLAKLNDNSRQIINPPTFSLAQDKTSLNATQLDITYLRNNAYGFIAWQGSDTQARIPHPLLRGVYKRLYNSNLGNLTFTYSYSQRSCLNDNRGNSYDSRCPEENVNYYFKHKKITQPTIANDLITATIPLTDEYLNTLNQPSWYLAPASSTIHRIDLYVCDEASNCVQRIARFKVNVIVDSPTLTDLVLPQTSKNTLKDINSFKTSAYNSPITTRVFEITNPTRYPVFFTLAANQPATKVKIIQRKYKRINAYYRSTSITSYTGRTQVYSGGTTYDNRYRCNYRTSSGGRGPNVEIFSDTFPASVGFPHKSGTVNHYGHCGRGGSRTHSFRVSGYPKNVDADYKRTGNFAFFNTIELRMQYHSALDENNVPYHSDSYYVLAPGGSKRIRIQETLPSYASYSNNNPPLPSNYVVRPHYNWKATSYLDKKVNIKFGRADLSGLLEKASVINYVKTSGDITPITTSGRFIVLPGTPK